MRKTIELPEDIETALVRLGFKGNTKDGQEICDWFREKHDILISVRIVFNVPKWETRYGYAIDGTNRRGSSASEDYVHGRPKNMIGITSHPKHVILPSCRVEYYEAMTEGIKNSIQFIKS